MEEKIIKIGYVYSFRPSPQSMEKFSFAHSDMFNALPTYSYIKFEDLYSCLDSLHKGTIDYVIIPSRLTYDNVVSSLVMDVIDRMKISGLNEYFCFVDENVKYVEVDNNDSSNYSFFGRKFYEARAVDPNDDKEVLNYLEYKVFKKNTFKVNRAKYFFQSIFTSYLGIIIYDLATIISVLVLATVLVLSIINYGKTMPDVMKIVGESIPFVVILFQIFVKLFNVKEKAQRGMITGYWLYYSFEDQYISGNYVPKGFTTRLLQITNDGNDLTFSCKFSGNDTNFFSSSNNEFVFSPATKVGEGSYHYVTNMINNKGKRAEGVCLYRGIKEKHSVIEAMDGWFSGRGTGVNGRVKYLRISKEDYNFLMKAYPDRSKSFRGLTLKFGVFGDEKSNTDVSFNKIVKEEEIFEKSSIQKVFYNDFHTILSDLENRRIDGAIVPISNRNNNIKVFKSDLNVEKLFSNKSTVTKFKTYSYNIEYVIAAQKPDCRITDDTTFISNEEAFKQCSEFVSKYNKKAFPSTSYAAKVLRTNLENKNTVVICNEDAALFYNLVIMDDEKGNHIDPRDSKENYTTFALYLNNNVVIK